MESGIEVARNRETQSGTGSAAIAVEDQSALYPSHITPIKIHILASELVFGLLTLIFWFGLFAGGILIGTGPYRAALQQPAAVMSLLTNSLVVCAFWTITNIGILSCIASYLGALGSRTHFAHRIDPLQSRIGSNGLEMSGLRAYYASAIMRSFGIYALVLAGLLVLVTESLSSPTQATYMRLAPMVTIVSFYAGYDPRIFAGLLDRVKSFMQADPSWPPAKHA